MKATSRFLIGFSLLLIAVSSSLSRAQDNAQALQPNDFVAICGDSITEQRLYSAFIERYLLTCQPASGLQAMQQGWSGERAPGFLRRLDDQILRFKPTVATTCFGMNDGGYGPMTEEKAKNYREAMAAIVRRMKEAGVRFIVVGSPGAVDTDTFKRTNTTAEEYNRTLAGLRDIAKEVAAEQGVAFADVHAPMIDAMAKAKAKYGEKYHVGGSDGVHPVSNGHLVMAYALLKGLGCDGNIGTITYDVAAAQASATDGHTVLSAGNGVIEIESTRHPFVVLTGNNDPASPSNPRSILEFVPFNEELNRYMLVVKNAGSAKVKITWGETSKEFDAAQLETGINLAAEFLDNPFSGNAKAVADAIFRKQTMEVRLVKQLLANVEAFKEMAPGESESFDRIVAASVENRAKVAQETAATVQPVRHTIRIEMVQ